MGRVYMLVGVSETRSGDHPNRVAIWVDWTETALWPGRLGLSATPGRTGHLTDDLLILRRTFGAQVLVELQESGGAEAAGPEDAAAQAEGLGPEELGPDVLRLVFPVGQAPHDLAAFTGFADEVMNRLLNGETVLVCGPGGSGPAATLAACLLVQAGMTPGQAVRLVQGAGPGIALSAVQVQFVEQFGA